jgi:hypothetical protein
MVRLECEHWGERRMNLIDKKGEEVNLLVDEVNTIDQLGPGLGILFATDRSDMLINVEYERCLEELLLAGWRNGSV